MAAEKMAEETQTTQKQIIAVDIEFVGRVIILAIGLLLLSRNVNGWFTGWREENNALYSIFARNHVQYGLGYTKLFNTWGDTAAPPAQPHRYLNHPPLLSVWVAIPMYVFGDHEWVARSVPIATTLGSVLLLMIIVSRLQSPALGLLSGLFYVTLPLITYFGRMLDHESPVQFFSLLMLHGYLQWTGIYGGEYSRKAGALYYALGTILGIGTGWTAIVMAVLIWLWHIGRTFGSSLQHKILLWVTIIPAASQAAVILHIMWGCQWKTKWLGALLLSRTVGPQHPLSWSGWFSENFVYLRENVSDFGIAAAVVYLLVTAVSLRLGDNKKPFLQKIMHTKIFIISVLLMMLQGLIWILAFRHQSSAHDYWQYFLGPFFAVAIAAVLQWIFALLSEWMPRTAKPVVLLLAMLPMPSFAYAYDMLYQYQIKGRSDEVAFFKKLAELVPPRVPVMASEKLPEFSETYGDYTNCWTEPYLAYYVNRRVVSSTDIKEIESNREGCAAYVISQTGDPDMERLVQQLSVKYEQVRADENVLIFFLNRPKDK